MTAHPALGAWLAERSDEQLIRLLELRPDLTQPPPGNYAALAARAQARHSVMAGTERLDYLTFAVIDALLVLHAGTTPVPVADVIALLQPGAPAEMIAMALGALRERALVWGDDDVRLVADAAAALPWHPGQVALEQGGPSPEEIATLLDGLDATCRGILSRLADGPPIGRTKDAAPGTPADRPIQRLLAAGLLRPVDEETVILPRRVGQILRGEEPVPATIAATVPDGSVTTIADVDAAAAGAVIDLLREVEVLLQSLSTAPVPELRSGGLGVREMKRLAKITGIEDRRLALILELCAAAELIAAGDPEDDDVDTDGNVWAPTVNADRFLDTPTAGRWLLLAETWLELAARPDLVGRRGPDNKPVPALSFASFSNAARLDRFLLLELLGELPAGKGLDAATASRVLRWLRPRWSARLQLEPVAALMSEATALGLVGRGALSTPAAALLSTAPSADVVKVMERALPEPIDYFLVQADLTVVVPGPLNRDLADQLSEVAAVESAGAAMVYRVSEGSIRHALDTGRTADALHTFFAKHSKTPVPQGLSYLIDDVARRHGQLRIGVAQSFVRCDDPALLAQVVASPMVEDLEMRRLAPTVAVSQAQIGEVLDVLRRAGFVPAAEDSTGSIVDLRARGARVKAPTLVRRHRTPPPPVPQTLEAVVATLRKVAAAPPANVVDAGTAVVLLQQAVRDQISVIMGYVDPAGVATHRVVTPISVRGGQLIAFDPAANRVREFAIHRVKSVVAVDEEY